MILAKLKDKRLMTPVEDRPFDATLPDIYIEELAGGYCKALSVAFTSEGRFIGVFNCTLKMNGENLKSVATAEIIIDSVQFIDKSEAYITKKKSAVPARSFADISKN
jgi:hypothetical protein